MDEKNNENRGLTEYKIDLEEYKNFKQMLNSTDEDQTVAIENLKNIECSFVYKLIILKSVSLEKRKKVLDEIDFFFDKEPFDLFRTEVKKTWGSPVKTIDLSWNTIYKFIKDWCGDSKELHEFFEVVLKYETNEVILSSLDMEFIDNVEIKIKW